mgnify:CR=1 FL=1
MSPSTFLYFSDWNVFCTCLTIVEKIIQRIHSIQYDSLNVVARNADLVLQARVKDYSESVLYDILYKEHKLIIIPRRPDCDIGTAYVLLLPSNIISSLFPIFHLYFFAGFYNAFFYFLRNIKFTKSHNPSDIKMKDNNDNIVHVKLYGKAVIKAKCREYLNGRITQEFENGDFEFSFSVPEHETFWYGVIQQCPLYGLYSALFPVPVLDFCLHMRLPFLPEISGLLYV